VLSAGRDTITDFVVGQDVIEARGYAGYVSAVQQGADTLVSFAGGETLLLKNVAATTLGAADFHFGASASPPPSSSPPPPPPNLTLRGTTRADVLTGGSGNDVLDGRGGADTLTGGLGNDTYYVDNARDRVVERAGEGIDTVVSKVTWTLGEAIENLTLTGTGKINGYGNALDNVLTGAAGANVLSGGLGDDRLTGGAGADTLYGGAGADVFVFARGSGKDVIADWGAGDVIDVSALLQPGRTPTLRQSGTSTLISFATGETITLKNVAVGSLSHSDDWRLIYATPPLKIGESALAASPTEAASMSSAHLPHDAGWLL
jgi:Ca2+-binding RTX toxin-like protein